MTVSRLPPLRRLTPWLASARGQHRARRGVALLLLGTLLWLLATVLPSEAASYHTLTIDGTNDFAADEEVPGTSASTWYFTWDATNFYFGINGSDVSGGSPTEFVVLYIDTDPQTTPTSGDGTSTGVTYNTQTPGLPFNADYHFRWKADNTYTNLLNWNNSTSSWTDDNTTGGNFGISAFQSGTFLEVSIPRSSLGNPDALYVAGAMLNEVGGGESTFFMTPSSNSPGYDANFTDYFGFGLGSGVSPNDAENLNTTPLSVVATDPVSNALDIATTSTISATFDRDVDSTSVSTSTFTVRGEQTALYDGSYSFPSADSVQLDPNDSFKPGEVIQVQVSDGLLADNGMPSEPYGWQFTAAASGGSGSYSAHASTPSFGAGSSTDVALGDIDADGDLDALVANASGQAETVWVNNGSGSYSAHASTPSFGVGESFDVALGDIDADGDLDALVANIGGQAETVWVNDGSGSYSAHASTPSFGAGQSIAVALGDIDGDGDLDALVANSIGQAETVWVNQNRADLSLSKVASPANAQPGQSITYTLSYTNSGPQSASGVEISDLVPSSLSNVSYTSSGATITATGGTPYTWDVADLAVGAGGVIIIT
ncbi:MAG: VCBS repeat-containing protein, partial [Ardenticatenales bacterium]|nr:VCBS repeat-containing protein [Ardenticatenales bacterium]